METAQTVAKPKVASKEEWLVARKRLLAEEKALTKQKDRINAQRRRLPMVKVDKVYEFDTLTARRALMSYSRAESS